MNGHVGPPAPGQRASGRTLLDVDQLAQRMAAEVAELLHIRKRRRDSDISCALVDSHEGDGLVGGTFHEELHLCVLVGCAECGEWGRSDPCALSPMLAKTLRPPMPEPQRDIPEGLPIGHEA